MLPVNFEVNVVASGAVPNVAVASNKATGAETATGMVALASFE